MKNRKGIAEDLKKYYFSDAINKKDLTRKNQAHVIFNIMYNYYKIYDLDNNTNHCNIFECLYLSKKYLSDLAIAQKMFISIDTLRKYIVKYNRLTTLLVDGHNFKL